MTFKANIVQKIQIKAAAQKVLASIGPFDSGLKVDKTAMRRLLELGGYDSMQVRDLELYSKAGDSAKKRILVLDNELPLYHTTVEDVALRKSPLIKEMVKIKNAIKILKDSDVLVSKKDQSVMLIRDECIEMLDLSHNQADLENIAQEGQAALGVGDADGVVESLAIFAELLGYLPVPQQLAVADHIMFCEHPSTNPDMTIYGPFIFYSLTYNKLQLLVEMVDIKSKESNIIRQVIIGKEKPTQEGQGVFDYLLDSTKKG